MGWPGKFPFALSILYSLIDSRAQYRVYRLADVDFGDKISHTDRVMYYSETRAIGNVPAIGSISIKEELWSATVKGKTVAVKTYRGPIEVCVSDMPCYADAELGTFQMFRANVDALRYLRYNLIVLMLRGS